ncbi:MAG: hypothetical protein AVDCRST_MAG54-503, partial [uncultured Actinomycetospora sp.]
MTMTLELGTDLWMLWTTRVGDLSRVLVRPRIRGRSRARVPGTLSTPPDRAIRVRIRRPDAARIWPATPSP